MNQGSKRLLSVEEAAVFLGISPKTLFNAIAPGAKQPFAIRPKKYGKRRLFDIKDLDAWADSLPYVDGTEPRRPRRKNESQV